RAFLQRFDNLMFVFAEVVDHKQNRDDGQGKDDAESDKIRVLMIHEHISKRIYNNRNRIERDNKSVLLRQTPAFPNNERSIDNDTNGNIPKIVNISYKKV